MGTHQNSYSYSRDKVAQQYAPILTGSTDGFILICSCKPLPLDCDDALRKSFAALGYDDTCLTYLVATPDTLQASEVYRLIEAIDPGMLIAIDAASKELIEDAYRLPHDNWTNTRVGGRPAVLFDDMQHLMEDKAGHQVIWSALKTLPKR